MAGTRVLAGGRPHTAKQPQAATAPVPCDRTRLRYGDSLKYDGVSQRSGELVQFALVNTLDLRTGKYD